MSTNEEKIRAEFENWLFNEHTNPPQSISYTAEELMFELWGKLKACASQTDELKRTLAGNEMILLGTISKFGEMNGKTEDEVIAECRSHYSGAIDYLLSAEREAGRKEAAIDLSDEAIVTARNESAEELAKAKEEVLMLRCALSNIQDDQHMNENRYVFLTAKQALTNTSESATKYAEELRKEGCDNLQAEIDAMPTVAYMYYTPSGALVLTAHEPAEWETPELEAFADDLL